MLTSFSIDVPLVSDCCLPSDLGHRFLDRGRGWNRGGGRGIYHHWLMMAIDNNGVGDYEPTATGLLAALIRIVKYILFSELHKEVVSLKSDLDKKTNTYLASNTA